MTDRSRGTQPHASRSTPVERALIAVLVAFQIAMVLAAARSAPEPERRGAAGDTAAHVADAR